MTGTGGGMLPGRLAAGALAALLAAALWVYPLGRPYAAAALLIYGAVLWRWPASWLLLVPAVLPWLDLAPWSGWFYLEEIDLVLLATAVVGYWRLGGQAPVASLPPLALVLLGLVGAASAAATVLGLLPVPPLDLNAFASYNSHFNSLRIAKGWLWLLLLLPLLRRGAGPELANIERLFVPGMLLGLLFTALAVVWERMLFPGLLNFSSEYRPTAPFSAMHTGGAALDAYLAMSFPFVAWWLVAPRSRRQLAAAAGLLLLGLFTGFATFSRDVFLAYAASGALVALLVGGPQLRRGHWRLAPVAAVALLLAALTVVLIAVFASGGYRTLGAILVLLGAALLLGGVERRVRHPAPAGAAALLLMLADLGLYALLRDAALPGWAKGPYLAFLLTAAGGALALCLALRGPARWRPTALALAMAAFPALALCSALIALHWGGAAALGAAAIGIAIALAMPLVSRLRRRPLWRLGRATLTLALCYAAVTAIAIPITGSSYMGERLSTVAGDWSLRTRHWREALAMMTPDVSTSLFGMGLGRYPDTYFWHSDSGEMPGSFRYVSEPGNVYLRLLAPHHALGFGEVLRNLQNVALEPQRRYRLTLDVRRESPSAQLWLGICQRWLLYPENCRDPRLQLAPADGAWHHYSADIDSGELGRRDGLLRAPTQLELSSSGDNTQLDVDNVSLRDLGSGVELVRNGSFSDGQDGWFFSSDRDHLPWHIKNFYVNSYFEQGWAGSVALGLLLLYTVGQLAGRAWLGQTGPAVCLAALTGALVVGMFDSLFDVPKLTLLFFLLIVVALLRPTAPAAPPRHGQRRRRAAGTPERTRPPA